MKNTIGKSRLTDKEYTLIKNQRRLESLKNDFENTELRGIGAS